MHVHNSPDIPCWEATCCPTLFSSSFQHKLSVLVTLVSLLFHNHHMFFSSPTPLPIAVPTCPCFILLLAQIPFTHQTIQIKSHTLYDFSLPPIIRGFYSQLHSVLLKCTNKLLSYCLDFSVFLYLSQFLITLIPEIMLYISCRSHNTWHSGAKEKFSKFFQPFFKQMEHWQKCQTLGIDMCPKGSSILKEHSSRGGD